MNFGKKYKIQVVKAAQTVDTGAVNSDAIDMQGWNGVIFLACIHTANAGNYVNAAQGALENGSDAADLEGTKITPTANREAIWLDVYKPGDRYVRLEIARGASTATGEVWAILYEGRLLPPTNLETDVVIGETHISPDEGTA